ncbi:InlB B-repeat-containing protein, partial [Bifidobacterium callitrichos]
MTGNTSKWRAPLAGLASIAMLATMGMVAGTANAATNVTASDWSEAASDGSNATKYTVLVYRADQPYDRSTAVEVKGTYGQVEDLTSLADPYDGDSSKILSYFSTDLAGEHKVPSDYVLTGDVKLFAQYKDAVTVTFDVDNTNSVTAADKTVKIAKGSALTADDYAAALDTNANGSPKEPGASAWPSDTFVGWTTTYSASKSSDALYEGAAINADTTLYPRVAAAQNVATITFRNLGESVKFTRATLNGHAFPAYRLPMNQNAKGSWDYDFKTPISAGKNIGTGNDYYNADDVDANAVFTPADASAQDVTVVFNYQDGGARGVATEKVETTSDQQVTAPTTPAQAGAVFTGWYTVRDASGQSNKYDFDKSVDANFKDATGVVNLYAGWDYTNVSRIKLNLKYKTALGARIIEYVRPGSTVTLPAGLEEYYQTEAQQDADKGEYTASKLTGWEYGSAKDVVTTVKAPAAKSTTELTAHWSTDHAYLLDANGGKFADGSTSQWATVAEGAAISFPVPTRAGYTFGAWQVVSDGDSAAEGLVLNSANGQFYAYNDKFENFFDINSKPVVSTQLKDLTGPVKFKALWWSGAV